MPDKFILLKVSDQLCLQKITDNLIAQGTILQGEDLWRAAEQSLAEYHLNIKGIKDQYKGFLYEIDLNVAKPDDTKFAIKRMI